MAIRGRSLPRRGALEALVEERRGDPLLERRGAEFANGFFDARELSVRVGDLGVRVPVEPVSEIAQLSIQVSVESPVRGDIEQDDGEDGKARDAGCAEVKEIGAAHLLPIAEQNELEKRPSHEEDQQREYREFHERRRNRPAARAHLVAAYQPCQDESILRCFRLQATWSDEKGVVDAADRDIRHRDGFRKFPELHRLAGFGSFRGQHIKPAETKLLRARAGADEHAPVACAEQDCIERTGVDCGGEERFHCGLKVERGCQLLLICVFKRNAEHQAVGAKLELGAMVARLVYRERDVGGFVRLPAESRPGISQGLYALFRQILDDPGFGVSGTVDLLRQIRQNPEITADDVVALLGDEEPVAYPGSSDKRCGHRESGNP